MICAVIAICIGTILTIRSSGATSAGQKVVLVNVDNLFNNYQKTIELNQRLEKIVINDKRYYTVSEVCRMLGILKNTLYS